MQEKEKKEYPSGIQPRRILYDEFERQANKIIKMTNPNDKFRLETDDDNHFIGTIIRYFVRDEDFFTSRFLINEPSLDKGLLIIGNTGVGKTLIMEALKECNMLLNRFDNSYKFTTSNNIVRRYDRVGQVGIEHFFNDSWYIDDIGAEDEGGYFGKKMEVMKLLIEEREKLFTSTGIKTHASSNLTTEEIRKRYGARISDRLYKMFNIVVYSREKSFRK